MTSNPPLRVQTYRSSGATQSMSYSQNITLPPTPRLLPITLPQIYSEVPALNPLLAYAARPKISYHLRSFSPRAHLRHPKPGWDHEPATDPSMSFMVLKCVILQEGIPVFPSNGQFVTVRDVLFAVYAHVRGMEQGWVLGSSSQVDRNVNPEWDRFMWGGLSEQMEPGVWLLHIEKLY